MSHESVPGDGAPVPRNKTPKPKDRHRTRALPTPWQLRLDLHHTLPESARIVAASG